MYKCTHVHSEIRLMLFSLCILIELCCIIAIHGLENKNSPLNGGISSPKPIEYSIFGPSNCI